MKIALLHYHLKAGGVTGVIQNQLAALKDDCDLVVLTGTPPPRGFWPKTAHVHGIGYDSDAETRAPAEQIADRVAEAIGRFWPEGCDVLHIHNPLLAKNRRFPEIIAHLQKKAIPLLLQVHDFAEDGRPDVYFRDAPYPADCHYGVINSRDFRILQDAGLDKKGLHRLPNPVRPLAIRPCKPGGAPAFAVYPVRAIRRKNIGEALLLSVYFEKGLGLAVTLPPNSERDRRYYRQWKAFAAKQGLGAVFEASEKFGFDALAAGARFFLTTSITEGFGFAFVEPWSAGKPLFGRKLDVCDDFEAAGIRLDHLYGKLAVPLSWIDRDLFKRRWRACLEAVFSGYGARPDPGRAAAGFERMTAGGRIDFAMIDEPFQRRVIEKVQKDAGARRELINENPFLENLSGLNLPEDLIRANREAVNTRFDLSAYRRRLLDTYQKVAAVPVRHRIDKKKLLQRFLLPETFSLLKWCDNEVQGPV